MSYAGMVLHEEQDAEVRTAAIDEASIAAGSRAMRAAAEKRSLLHDDPNFFKNKPYPVTYTTEEITRNADRALENALSRHMREEPSAEITAKSIEQPFLRELDNLIHEYRERY